MHFFGCAYCVLPSQGQKLRFPVSTAPWSARRSDWPLWPPRHPHSRERALGRGAGPGSAGSNRSLPTPPATGPPRRSLALPRAPPASYWRGWRGAPPPAAGGLAVGAAAGSGRVQGASAARARHGAAAAAPAAAALPRLAAPPGETPRPPLPPGGASRRQPLGSAEGGRESRRRGRWGGFSALLARGWVCGNALPAHGVTALTQPVRWLLLP